MNRRAAGIVEAKPEGHTLVGVETQSEKYSTGLPDILPAYRRPLPFLYQSTGVESRFTNLLDPDSRSRSLFAFHKPETWPRGSARRKAPPTPMISTGQWPLNRPTAFSRVTCAAI